MKQTLKCDVLVAGGGTAGLAAAICAARAGAHTVLVERNGFLGGMGTAALVHTICGLYLVREEAGAIEANSGFSVEFARRLVRQGAAKSPVRMGRLDVLPHEPWGLALVADQLVSACPNLQVLLHSEIYAATCDEQGWQVSMISRGTSYSLQSAMAIDTTGDATLAALAGASWRQAEAASLQRPAYIVKLGPVGSDAFSDTRRLQLAHGIASAVKSGRLPVTVLGAAFRAGLYEGEGFLTLDLAGDADQGLSYDPTDAVMLTQLEQSARETVQTLVQWLAETQSDFSKVHVLAWPVRAGVRESRRLAGQYELTGEDILQSRSFSDDIALATWPLELREKATGPRWRFPESMKPAGIPLRSLRSQSHPTLLAAGRCLSASHEALASVRVMGTCLATGEAAGLAAVLMLEDRSLQAASAHETLAGLVGAKRLVLSSES